MSHVYFVHERDGTFGNRGLSAQPRDYPLSE